MVDNESRSLDLVFHALSDPTRREILRMLTRGELTVGKLADPFKMSLAAVSKHIKVLEEAGLLMRARDGRIHRCTMNAGPLRQAQDVIRFYQEFWEGRFHALDRYLQASLQGEFKKPKGDGHGNRKK